MENFLKIVYQLHYEKRVDEDVIKHLLEPMVALMQDTIKDEEIVEQLTEELTNCLCEARDYFAVDGMKLATDVINGKYTPTI